MSSRAAVTRSFVHSLPSSQLHGLAFKLNRSAREADLSPHQEWLWGVVILELEERWLRAPVLDRCSCELCFSPFADPDDCAP